jgi:hypothetical protein
LPGPAQDHGTAGPRDRGTGTRRPRARRDRDAAERSAAPRTTSASQTPSARLQLPSLTEWNPGFTTLYRGETRVSPRCGARGSVRQTTVGSQRWDARTRRAGRSAEIPGISDRPGCFCYSGATCPFAHGAYGACIFIACRPHPTPVTGARHHSLGTWVRPATLVGMSHRTLTGSAVRRG